MPGIMSVCGGRKLGAEQDYKAPMPLLGYAACPNRPGLVNPSKCREISKLGEACPGRSAYSGSNGLAQFFARDLCRAGGLAPGRTCRRPDRREGM